MFGNKKQDNQRSQSAPTQHTSATPGSTGLSGDTKIKHWLAHPQGGPILRHTLAEAGQDEDRLKPVRGFSMKRLIPVSKGQFTEEKIAELVALAEAYDPGSAPVATRSHAAGATEAVGDDEEFELPEFQEKITDGRFAGKTVIVTGAGSGIGRATASRIAREGGRVVAVDLNEVGLDDFIAEHGAVDGERGEIVKVVANVTKDGDIAEVVATAGPVIDGLANVAGILDNMTPLHEVTDEVWEKVMAVNVTGLFKLSRAVLPTMLAANAGSIVNIASEAGLRGSAAGLAYTASKHAVVGITKSSAFMYGPLGIRVNAVAPGPTITGIEASFDSEWGGKRIQQAMAAMPTPVGPDSVAASISFLLSDDGTNLNGVIVPSDGGWSAV